MLRVLGLGDLLTGLPALRALSRFRPRASIYLCTSAGVAPLARAALPDLTVVAVGELAPLPFSGPVDLAVNLHGAGERSRQILADLSPRSLLRYGAPARKAAPGGVPPWPAETHDIERWCALVDLIREGARPADRSDLRLDLKTHQPTSPSHAEQTDVTVLHPGASAPARRWPAERWAAVARAEHAKHRTVVVTGSRAEASRCEQIVRLAGLDRAANLAGTTVMELVDIVAASNRVVCGDTGVGHLATALGRPSVLLFGPSAPQLWGPTIDRHLHRVLWSGTTGDPNGDQPDPGLIRIVVDQVLDAIADLDGLESDALSRSA